jgi:hypothetical protein
MKLNGEAAWLAICGAFERHTGAEGGTKPILKSYRLEVTRSIRPCGW